MFKLRRFTGARALLSTVLTLLAVGMVATGPAMAVDPPQADETARSAAELTIRAQAGGATAEKTYAGERPRRASRAERDHFSDKKHTKLAVPPPLNQPASFVGDGGTSPTGSGLPGTAEMPTIPQLSAQLASTALWDLEAEDDHWPEIGAIVRKVINDAGLAQRQIRYRPDREPEPLVSRMPTAQSLLIIGSHREFTDAEARAVGDHVRTGGALLAIANISGSHQRRLPAFNRILAEFGLAARMTRPGGDAQVADAVLTRLVRLQRLPAGLSIWGFNDWELVKVGDETVASAQVSQSGRVFVLDGGMLVADERRVAGEFKQLLGNAVLWLIGKE